MMPQRKRFHPEDTGRRDPKSQSMLNVDIFELGIDPDTASEMESSLSNDEDGESARSGKRKKKSPRHVARTKTVRKPIQKVEDEDEDEDEDIEFVEDNRSHKENKLFDNGGEEDDITMMGEENNDSDIAKAIFALLGDKDFRTKSELSDQDIKDLTMLTHISRSYNCKSLLQLVSDFCHFRVSLERGSRKEVVDAFSGMSQFRNQGSPDGQLLQKLRGNV